MRASQRAAAAATKQAEWWSGGTVPLLDLQAEKDPFKPPEKRNEMKDEFGDRVTVAVIPERQPRAHSRSSRRRSWTRSSPGPDRCRNAAARRRLSPTEGPSPWPVACRTSAFSISAACSPARGPGQMLADFGADVIKVEHPVHGDDVRRMGVAAEGRAGPRDRRDLLLSGDESRQALDRHRYQQARRPGAGAAAGRDQPTC